MFKLTKQDEIELAGFVRELVRTPSPSTQEGAVAQRVAVEMERVGLRDVRVDAIGNVVGWLGPADGPILMFNAHMDTVGVSDPALWRHDPYGAAIEDGAMYGLGAADMKAGLGAMLHAAKLLRDAGVTLNGRLMVACLVQEEPCEGLGSRVLIEQGDARPDWVVLGEPTGLNICRGQRGRLEVAIHTHGQTAHASRPDRGKNAVYTAARLIFGLEMLGNQLGRDSFLGDGTLAVTEIRSLAGSRNAIPDRCNMIVDRRLTLGETEAMALAEIERVIAREGVEADAEVTEYRATSYTGYDCRQRAFYPAWLLAEDHPLIRASVRAVRAQTGRRPHTGFFSYSTEGTYTAGVAGIPTVGIGPGDEDQPHTTDEHVRLCDIYAAASIYARLAVEMLGKRR